MITDPVFSITSAGASAPSYDDVLEYFKSRAREIFGGDINLDADTQDGQLLAVFALAVSDVNSQAIAVYNSFNPQTATGVALDSAVRLNGITRRCATHSSADVTIVGQAGTVITNGVVVDANENKWQLPSNVIIPREGEITVTATAQVAGKIVAPIGSINRIATPTRGWQTVTNKRPSIDGVAVETDAELRLTQTQATMLPSISLWGGIVGAVKNLNGVKRVSGINNDSAITNKESIPAHTISLVVDGGDAQEIANTIYMKKGVGVGTYGTTTKTVRDTFNVSNSVSFYRPTTVKITAEIHITPSDDYISSVADEIKSRVVQYVNQLSIGDDVSISRALASVIKNNETIDNRFEVSSITLGKNEGGKSAANIVCAWNESANTKNDFVTVIVDER